MPTMKVSQFVVDATHCSGRIQALLGNENELTIESIVDDLSGVEAYATESTTGRDLSFDVLRVGVDEQNRLRIEIQRRWTLDRVLTVTMYSLAAVVFAGALVGLAYLIGVEVTR